ncbi:ANK-REP-REGION domain-containing protein [Mycena sanguinolenta]|uniref:ANK-REP-REGION domain-containing protein n=1 Tax=Mycena sanguinolenta TaxID=230812 RepID=A0A8H6YH17_9AGAR|nr:ANK-REP-REGION domain-containing protein [Mycena sanguinolenta]
MSSDSTGLLELRTTYGAIYIGVVFAALFQGMLTVQAYIYYEGFPDDSWVLKWLVAVVWTLDLVHLVVIASVPWLTLVENWGNPAVFLNIPPCLPVHVVLVAVATLLCQAFFLRRLWRFSQKNRILVGILGSGSLIVCALDFFLAVQMLEELRPMTYQGDTAEIASMFSIRAATDLSLALTLVWYLHRGIIGFDRTNFVIARIIQYTVATGLATSILALACVLADVLNPQGFTFMALHFSLGRMYTNALLATLNSRKNLRAALETTHDIQISSTAPVSFLSTQGSLRTEEYALSDRGDKVRTRAAFPQSLAPSILASSSTQSILIVWESDDMDDLLESLNLELAEPDDGIDTGEDDEDDLAIYADIILTKNYKKPIVETSMNCTGIDGQAPGTF